MDMKTIFVIQPHSFIDVITNSSTELFVCGKEQEIDTVREVLKSWEEVHKNFKDTYEVRRPTQQEMEYKNWKWDWYLRGYEKNLDENSIIIEWTGDNDIPYWFFDLIEDEFNASRYHLG